MARARTAISGMSTSGLTSGSSDIICTIAPMPLAWSPMRSRSTTIESTEITMRRSRAIGPCWASRSSTWLSSSKRLRFTSASSAHHRVGERDIALDERDDRPLDLAIDHRAHLEQAVLELVEVSLELLSRHLPGAPIWRWSVLLPVGSPLLRAAADTIWGDVRGAASGTSRSGP